MAEKSPRGNVLTVETRSVVLNIRIKPSLKAAIEKLAAKDHRTLSNQSSTVRVGRRGISH